MVAFVLENEKIHAISVDIYDNNIKHLPADAITKLTVVIALVDVVAHVLVSTSGHEADILAEEVFIRRLRAQIREMIAPPNQGEVVH